MPLPPWLPLIIGWRITIPSTPLPGWIPLTPGIHPFSTRHVSGLMGSTTKARSGRQGRLADYLTLDFVVLDELGYLPFAQTGDQLLFHLISRL